MTAHLAHIRRHPIKSVGGEDLGQIALQAARRLPGDREWAVLTEAGERHARKSQSDGEPDRWMPKTQFLRGVTGHALQAVKGGWQDQRISLTHPDRPALSFDPVSEGAALLDWLRPLWPGDASPASRLVRGAAIWTDSKWPWISILSLDSLADLETRMGQQIGIDRWRGNLWLKGLPPQAEADLIGQVIHIGPVELRVTDHITRCDATSANSETGSRDCQMLDRLQEFYGHTNFGIFAEVVTGGTIQIGDEVRL